jgi:putative membrane protein
VRLFWRWVATSVALLITIKLVPGLAFSGNPLWVLGAAVALGLLNVLMRPLLLLAQVLTLPLSCLTFGLWAFVLSLFFNILAFYFVGTLGWGFRVDGFVAAALGALVMSVINAVLTGLVELSRPRRGVA